MIVALSIFTIACSMATIVIGIRGIREANRIIKELDGRE